jgi:hypothetical protein
MYSKTIEEEAKEGAPTTCILCKPLGNRSIQRKQQITTTLHQLFHEDNENALGTCMVPSSAANALPTLPAMMMAVTTGESSLARARDNTPPTDLVSPSLANSRTNCKPNLQNVQPLLNICIYLSQDGCNCQASKSHVLH